MEQPCHRASDSFSAQHRDTLVELWKWLATGLPSSLSRVAAAHIDDTDVASVFSHALVQTDRDPALAALGLGMDGDWTAWRALIRDKGCLSAIHNVPLRGWYSLAASLRRELTAQLFQSGTQIAQLGALDALAQLMDWNLAMLHDAYHQARDEEVAAMRREERQALLLSERRYARLAEAGIIGILVCDIFGNIRDANEAFLAMVGYTRAELLSGSVLWSEMTPPEWAHLDARAVEQLKVSGVTRTWEKEYIRKDGSRVPILVGVAMLNDTECIAFVLDVSERRRLDELRQRSAELEAQNRRILESSRLQHEFLANMSHELRTPLNSIIGFADILYDGEVKADSPKHHEFLGHILKSGRHLLQLINDVLDLAKVEAGKLEFRIETLDLGQLIGDVGAVLRSTAETKQVTMTVDVTPEVRHVILDPSRLKQVLYNYASNALKFTSAGGQIAIRAMADGPNFLRVEVEDTGIGISETDIGRLFVQFEQLDSGTTKHHAGTGLGLALTKRIVEAQGGSVGVTSVLGRGSTFFAILPRDATQTGATIESLESAAHPNATPVLVVEDDARDRTVLVELLSKAGYHVQTAGTGAQAIGLAAARKFGAITLDLLLPDMTGLDVLHRIRLEGQNRETPIVVVSVAADQGIALGFSVHDHLRKPVTGSELVASLRRAGVTPDQRGPILVVDDDPAARELMETLIRQRGFWVECCTDGESALSVIAAHKPIAVVLDLMMPKMDGFEFLKRFREYPEHRKTPVIIWTMKDLSIEDQTRLRGMAQSVIAKCHAKPQVLVEEIRSLLHTRSSPEAVPV